MRASARAICWGDQRCRSKCCTRSNKIVSLCSLRIGGPICGTAGSFAGPHCCCTGQLRSCSAVHCDGAGRAAENAGDLTNTVVLLLEAGEGHTVFGLELAVDSGLLRHLHTLRQVRYCTSDLNPPFLILHDIRRQYSHSI